MVLSHTLESKFLQRQVLLEVQPRTAVINAKGHTTLTQYDYYLGKPVDQANPNNVVTTISYNDVLDRLTQVIRANGTSVPNQTTFNYDDQTRIVTTTTDKDSYGDNQRKTATEYDGLGRQKETRQYEGPGAYIISRQAPDALGRVKEVWNPFQSSQGECSRGRDQHAI